MFGILQREREEGDEKGNANLLNVIPSPSRLFNNCSNEIIEYMNLLHV